jgi:hypothetical protein
MEANVRVVVPDLVGLLVQDAGHEAAVVVVVAADVDGPPLGALAWPGLWVVTAQDPEPGTEVGKWENVRVTFRRADGGEAGDREPRLPLPIPDDLEAHRPLND